MPPTNQNPFFVPPHQEQLPGLVALIQQWLQTPELAALVRAFGGNLRDVPEADQLSWLLTFSDRWDFRSIQKAATATDTREQARWQLDNQGLTGHQVEVTKIAAEALGLIGVEFPQATYFDYVWILGGAKLSCLLRTRHALGILKALDSTPQLVGLLGSFRPVASTERSATDTYAPHSKTEFDLLVAALSKELGDIKCTARYGSSEPEDPNESWKVHEYAAADIPAISILAAPSSEPAIRRANSADTYRFFLERYHVRRGSSVLLVTSQIYVPYQHLEAVRTVLLAQDVYLETVGFPINWITDAQGMNEPSNYLQEIRSTIQAIVRFVARNSLGAATD